RVDATCYNAGANRVSSLEMKVETQQALRQVLQVLPEDRLREVLDFARFIAQADEADTWRHFGQGQFARAFGMDEPEYSESAPLLSEPFQLQSRILMVPEH